MKISVFFHILDFPEGRHIIESQLNTLIASGIMEHSKLFFHCNYNIANYEWMRDRLKNYKNICFINQGVKPGDFEIPTLAHLKDYCDNETEESFVLYLHHKGITKPYSEPVRDWRDLMMYFNVTGWQDCVEKLYQGCDTAGALWRGDFQFPHYSGNFWWARSSYIKKLPAFRMPIENNYRSQFGFYHTDHRMDAEFWIGIGKPKAYCFHNFTVDHYSHLYPPELYRKKI